jgi:WD40 repeat protein
MAWPLSQDYNEAIQSPRTSFSDPELQAGQPATNALGIPQPCSGNFADVYQFSCPPTQDRWAVKCFTREVRGLQGRYAEISRHLQEARLPFAVDFQYLEQGVRIRGQWYPVLKMRWVEGLLLNEFVRANLDKPARLQALSQIWARMARRLREAELAHADLQHGNVILVPGSTANSLAIKLIDYDGMFVPALARSKSGEVGHPNYQHPQRLREETYNALVDRFPLLVVATALRVLSAGGRALWERYDNGDNLLFKEADLRATGDSALFRELQGIADPQAQMLVEALRKASGRGLEEVPALDELLTESKPATARVRAAPPADEPAVPLAVPVRAETPAPETDWDFDEICRPAPKKRPGRRGRLPLWARVAGGTAAAAAVIAFLMALRPPGGNADPPPEPLTDEKAFVVLQIDQPGADVFIDGTKIAVNVPGGGKPIKIGVEPGRYALRVSKDGFRPHARKIRLKAGDSDPIKVALEPEVDPRVRRAHKNRNGKWKREGDELVQESLVADCQLVFGDFTWKDYDFTCEAKKVGGTEGVGLLYRALGSGYGDFVLGASGNKVDCARCTERGHTGQLAGRDGGLEMGRWAKLHVRLRGTRCQCYLDDRPVFEVENRTNSYGAVGFWTWTTAVRFKNIRVTDPEGKVLFEGLPDLPATEGQWPPATETASEGQLYCLKGHGCPVTRVAFSGDGRQVLSCSDGQTVHIGPDGRAVPTASPPSSIRLWDVSTGKERFCGVSSGARGFINLALAPGASRFLSHIRDSKEVMLGAIADGKIQPQPVLLAGHPGISCLDFARDGSRARALGADGSFWEWDLEDNKLVHQVKGDLKGIACAALAPDGRFALLARGQQPFAEIDLDSGKETGRWKEAADFPVSLAFAPDGSRVLEGTGRGGVRLWDVAGGKVLHLLTGHQRPVRAVAFSPDGLRALTGGDDQTVRLWDLAGKRELACFTGHTGAVRAVAFSPDGGRAASGSADYTVRLWRLPQALAKGQEGKGPPRPVPPDVPVQVVTTAQHVLRGHADPVRHLLFTPDGSRLVSGSNGNAVIKDMAHPGNANSVVVWDVVKGEPYCTFRVNADNFAYGVQGIGLTADGRFVAACTSWDKGRPYRHSWVFVWDVDARAQKGRFQLPDKAAMRAVGFSTDGKTLFALRSGRAIHTWSFPGGKESGRTELEDQGADSPLGTTFTPGCRHVIGAAPDGKGAFRLWDPQTGKAGTRFVGHTEEPWGFALSPDGTRVLSCAGDGSVRQWDTASGRELFSLDNLGSKVRCVAFSPDGNRFLTGGEDGVVRLRDAQTGRELARFPGHIGKVHCVTFSPKGSFAVSGGEDKTVRVWPLPGH